jgi:hypothetical protein
LLIFITLIQFCLALLKVKMNFNSIHLERSSNINEPDENSPTPPPLSPSPVKDGEEEPKTSASTIEQSQDNKCPVCLQKLNSNTKSYASTCSHSFCFECLLEWSKIKYNCPLCKRVFDRIIYSVKSNYDYKEYRLPTMPASTNNGPPVEIIAYLPPEQALTSSLNTQPTTTTTTTPTVPTVYSKSSWICNKEAAPVSFRSMIYYHGWYVDPNRLQIETQVNEINLNSKGNYCHSSFGILTDR